MTKRSELNPVTDPKAVLRAVVPGVKADDYEVKNFYFTNFVAFLIAKAINEQLGTTIFDYGTIFSRSDGLNLPVNYLQFEGKEFTTEQMQKASDYALTDIITNLYESVIRENYNTANFGQISVETVVGTAVSYVRSILTECFKLWFIPKAELEELNKTGLSDDLTEALSGIGCIYTRLLAENIEIRDKSFRLWFGSIEQLLNNGVKAIISLFRPNATVTPNVTVNVQAPTTTSFNIRPTENTAQEPVNLVGWQDLKPGIITTDGSDPAPAVSGDTYESLNQEDRQIVDSLIQGMMHVSQMQQNPEAHQDEITAARAALHQELEGGAPQINIQPTTTEHHACNCGNDHCTCGGHH